MFRRKYGEESKASSAILEAQSHLHEVKSRSAEVKETVEITRNLRIRNHFGEQLTEMIKVHTGRGLHREHGH